MAAWSTQWITLTALFSLISTGWALYCYRCVSTIAGCGDELNIRLQRWHKCPDPTTAGENFCVKVIEERDGERFLTRECLATLQRHTRHRQQIPTVQRHGYCSLGRNNDPFMPLDSHTEYCFCNDWNGCNSADRKQIKAAWSVMFAMVAALVIRFQL